MNKTHSHLTLESDKFLNHMNKNLLKHNNMVSSLYAEKLVIAYETNTMRSSKNGMRNKPWLDQTGSHYKIVTIMLFTLGMNIRTYKPISSMKITCMPNTQPMHNT